MRVRNAFIQAIGVAAIAYLLLITLNWGMVNMLRLLTSFSFWYRHSFIYWAEEVAIALGVAYLLIAGVLASRN